MAEDFLISIAAKIVEYIVAPVGQWLCYSFHYNSNIENLKKQKEKLQRARERKENLQNARERVQHLVDVASRNGEEIYSDVRKWLIDVDCITKLATTKLSEIEEEAGAGSSNAVCQNSKHRPQLSREAKRMVVDIAKLLEDARNFNGVSYRPALQEMVTPRNMDYMVMNSRMTVVEEIMEALRSANIYKIGVWGMPGVGKSTLMEEIARQAKEEGIFNEVVVVVVTNNPVIRQIQGAIASTLGLNFGPETDKQKASLLQQRLKDKKILVILDDIWKDLGLQEIGIPSEGFKVVMTSRNRDVLNCGMGTQKEIELKTLQKEDALKLFEMRAGEIVRDPEVSGIATKIVEKCAGLPIALVTVSKALKNKNLSEWKDALRRLKRPAPEHVTEMLKTIYSPIELSYDSLESQELKSLVLLCAQLPYFLDYHDLLKYSYGYGLSHGTYSLEEARATLDTLLRKLKDSCLLLESSDGFCMHDLVRDVATIIASKNHNMFVMRDDIGGQKAWPDVDALNRCEALSIYGGEIHKHPNKMDCPELKFFHVNCKDSLNLKIPDIFFQGMDKLKVLSLRRMRLSSLSSLFPLTNLQTLCLEDECELGDIHGIGELKTLVILSLADSDISNLPIEIGSLTRLRLLDLTYCLELRVIPPNVLSSLVNLEELYMRETKVQWEVEGPRNEGKNSSLAELKKLSNLTTLEIDISNANNLHLDKSNTTKSVLYLCFPSVRELHLEGLPKIKHVWSKEPQTMFRFQALQDIYVGKCESLTSLFPAWVLRCLEQLKKIVIEDCGVEEIVAVEGGGGEAVERTLLFPQVTKLKFRNLLRLKWFYKGVHVSKWPMLKEVTIQGCHKVEIFASEVVSFEKAVADQRQSEMSNIKQPLFSVDEGKLPLIHFKNLKVLEVENCQKLRFVSSASIARGLSLLEKLKIKRCNNMGAIVLTEEKDRIEDGDVILFHQLQTLVLEDLPKLVSFPSLQTLHIKGLPKIKHVWSCGQEPKTVFIGLEQLKILEISNCGVEEIVAVEGGDAIAVRTLVFPRVTKLDFRYLWRLKSFYKGAHVSKWPMLKEMRIEGCDKVEIFASEVVSFGKTVEDQRQSEMSIKEPLFSVDELSFPSLETLHISHCEGLFHVFPMAILMRSLTDLRIKDCCSLETIFGKLEGRNGKEPHVLISPGSRTEESGAITNFASTVAFPSLQILRMEDLPKIKHVWSEYSKTIFNFQNLQEIQAMRCESLKSLFPISVVSCLKQLKIFEIEDCGVEEIVAVEGGGGEAIAIRTLVFPQVTKLDFRNLRKLKWFYKGVHVSKWPMLKEMKIVRCEKVEIFASEVVSFGKTVEDQRQSEMSIKQLIFSVDEDKLPLIYFKNLKVLEVENYQKLRFLFSSSIARGLSLLEKLKIKGCNNMGAIVVTEEKDGIEDGDVILFHQLQNLVLEDLPELVSFLSTKSSFMTDCGQIIAEGNHNLHMPLLHHQHRNISLASLIDTKNIIRQVSFPSLQTLHMEGLLKIKHVWSCDQEPKTDFRLQNLQEICAKRCESLKSLFPTSVVSCLEQLQVLKIEDCGVEEIVAVERGGGEAVARTLVFPRVTTLNLINLKRLKWFYKGVHVTKWPMLEKMKIEGCEKVKIFASGFLSFPSLKKLDIWNMDKLEIIWQDQVDATSFPNIQELTIFDCDKLLHVFQSNLHTTTTTLMQSLTYELVDREIRLRLLRLCPLRMLTHLWKEDSTQPCQLFHNLEYLDVLQCGKLKNLVPSSVSLHNLTRLEISDCHGLINLLTSSTAKTLVQLENMTVTDCKRITEIVAMEDDEANVAITFNKLRYLELRGLPNLTHFCSGPYSFGFPSLDEVIVRCCPEMKTFSHGVLSTPKLKGVYDSYRWDSKRNLHWEDDLNTTTRCLWEANQYDTRLLFRERVENSEEDEDHPSEDEDHSVQNFEEGYNVASPFRFRGPNDDYFFY
ncbi:hypothetical protein I3842_08G170000 [Carya illinoinensis]|uniref:AAA+ ATPase domain-containing protein n=1 Tax=Carya illinoinensis TaxID=32201 RepID=A0A922EDC1_CARIL|nr:hypothetical protein I3842_08G170000 [Carya illinoinensis]